MRADLKSRLGDGLIEAVAFWMVGGWLIATAVLAILNRLGLPTEGGHRMVMGITRFLWQAFSASLSLVIVVYLSAVVLERIKSDKRTSEDQPPVEDIK